MTFPIRSARRWLAAFLLAASLLSSGVRADTFEADSTKAGFIFNFIKYAEWPPTALPAGHLTVCSTSDQPLSGKLEALHGRTAQGREIRVRTAVRPGEWRDCQVLFIAAAEAQRIDAVLRSTSLLPILTVSDAPGFIQAGGIIGLKLQDERIRFVINHGTAKQSGLKLSSQLLRLADEILQ